MRLTVFCCYYLSTKDLSLVFYQSYLSSERKIDSDLSFMLIITYMKKLLDSDWLRAVQLKSNTRAKSVIPVQESVIPVQITNPNY